jgi:hypothetical protein
MIRRLFVPLLVSIIVIGGSASSRPVQSASAEPCAQDHEAWLTQVLGKMETIKPGMTRFDLLKVFRTQGGLPRGLRETFVSQDCPYFKIDVEFEPVAGLDNGGVRFSASPRDNRDVIVKVSKPYVQYATTN